MKSAELLRRALELHGVPVGLYGTGAAKSVDDLYQELAEGECTLWEEGGVIERRLRVLALDIFRDGRKLVEKKQIFLKDGRERSRALMSSTAEKMLSDETAAEAIARIANEEMPFLRGLPFELLPVQTEVKESQSYPGITARYEYVWARVTLASSQQSDVMVVEKDKLVYYNWE